MEFRDLKRQYRALQNDMDRALAETVASGVYIGGKAVEMLEQQLAEYVGRKHCISCANGTDALELVLTAWNIGPGQAVFVPDFTFFATAEAVAKVGAVPIFVDVLQDSFNLDPQSLERAIKLVVQKGELEPKAIIPVDLFGLPADYPAIMAVASRYDLLILEDGAQGFGGQLNGRLACSFGDASTTSFFPAKPLGCYGDGGAIFTDNDDLAQELRSLKVHGKGRDKYDNVKIGYNSRLDTLQAAVLLVKLNAFKQYELDRVNEVAEIYTRVLSDCVNIPVVPEGYRSSWAQYTVRLEDEAARNALAKNLSEQGIPTMVYYRTTMSRQTAFKSVLGHQLQSCPTAELLSQTVLSLPMHPYFEAGEAEKIAEAVRSSLGKS